LLTPSGLQVRWALCGGVRIGLEDLRGGDSILAFAQARAAKFSVFYSN